MATRAAILIVQTAWLFASTPSTTVTTQPAGPAMTETAVLDLAASAPMGQYLEGLRLEADNAETAFDAPRRRWEVVFSAPPRPGAARTGHHVVHLLGSRRRAFRVVVDDATATIAEQTILWNDEPAETMGNAVAVVRRSDGVGAWLTRHESARLDPTFRVYGGGWLIHVAMEGRPVGDVWVIDGRIVGDVGPWRGGAEERSTAGDVWLRLRPVLRFREAAWLFTLIAAVVLIDFRRLWSFRTLDALALAAFVPSMMLLRHAPAFTHITLMALTVYLTVRLAVRLRHASPPRPARPWHPLPAAVFLLAAFGWQLANVHEAERTHDAYADLFLGARLFQHGYIAYGEAPDGEDTYGPFRYALYGLVDQVAPSGAGEGPADTTSAAWQARVKLDGCRAVAVAFHLLAVACLIGLAVRVAGTWRVGVTWAAAYVLLSVSLRMFFTASRVLPAALMLLGLWAFPNPLASGLCLGLATADTWFPVFLFPLWLGSYGGRDRLRFAGTYAAVGVICFGAAMLGPGAVGERVAALMRAVVGYQGVGPGSPLAAGTDFWELLPWSPATTTVIRQTVFVAFILFCLAAFRWPRRRTPLRVIVMTALIVIGTQLWKPLNTARYLGWYLPFALIALFPYGRSAWPGREEDQEEPAT